MCSMIRMLKCVYKKCKTYGWDENSTGVVISQMTLLWQTRYEGNELANEVGGDPSELDVVKAVACIAH